MLIIKEIILELDIWEQDLGPVHERHLYYGLKLVVTCTLLHQFLCSQPIPRSWESWLRIDWSQSQRRDDAPWLSTMPREACIGPPIQLLWSPLKAVVCVMNNYAWYKVCSRLLEALSSPLLPAKCPETKYLEHGAFLESGRFLLPMDYTAVLALNPSLSTASLHSLVHKGPFQT